MTGTLNLPINGLVAGTNQLVLSGGNVGIGTTTPGSILQVNTTTIGSGEVRIVASGSESALGTYSSGGNWLAGVGSWNTIGNFTIGTLSGASPGPRLTINQSGNVGIGTTSPILAMQLERDDGVSSAVNHDLMVVRRNASTTGVRLGYIADGANVTAAVVRADSNSSLRLMTTGSWPNGGLTINNSGNVGIGTTSPMNTLDVIGNISASSGVGTVIYSTQPAGRFHGIAAASTSYLTGESLTITVPSGASRRYRIVMRQMLYNAIAGQAVVFLSTSSSNPNLGMLVAPYVALNAGVWSTVNTESYVTIAGGTSVTYNVWVNYFMTPSGPAVANESGSNRIYCDLFAVQM
jgi:hypothetical protein